MDKDRNRLHPATITDACCSFCDKSYLDVGPLVEGPKGGAFICRDCAALCLEIIERERNRRRSNGEPGK
ncbi:MAG TPA: ClpX C4-type zinc finger protein [Pirellulales bacterium]|nr:ClpX C4-type zinc finger protein [Pirellulales bacterium]